MTRLALLAALLLPLPAAAQTVRPVCDGAATLVDETRTMDDGAGGTLREWRVLLMLDPLSRAMAVTLTFRAPPGVVATGPRVVRLSREAPMVGGIILGTERLGRGTFPPKPPGGLDGLLGIACAAG